jgi:hypothetical protein
LRNSSLILSSNSSSEALSVTVALMSPANGRPRVARDDTSPPSPRS